MLLAFTFLIILYPLKDHNMNLEATLLSILLCHTAIQYYWNTLLLPRGHLKIEIELQSVSNQMPRVRDRNNLSTWMDS